MQERANGLRRTSQGSFEANAPAYLFVANALLYGAIVLVHKRAGGASS